MGGACREGFAVWRRPYNWRAFLKWRNWKRNKRVMFDDNVMPLVCVVLGHRPYNTACVHEPAEHACQRCHRWLRHLDPPVPVPSVPYFNNIKERQS